MSRGTSLVAETGRRVGRKLNCIRGAFLESAARHLQFLGCWLVHGLYPSNRRMRTRMSGGVAGVREVTAPQLLLPRQPAVK
jgi:hypothetical protein